MSSEERFTRDPEAVPSGRPYPATITDHAQAMAVLNDPGFSVVPGVVRGTEQSKAGPRTGIAWLRANVSRFVEGPTHTRRRALVEALLARIDPAGVRRRAYELTVTDPQPAPGLVTVMVLTRALGVEADVAPLVAVIAPSYFPESSVDSVADAAVDAVVSVLGGGFDEPAAAMIGLLVQAYDATAGLVGHALTACRGHQLVHSGHLAVEAVLGEVLRHDPPVPALRRVGPGGAVTVDVRAVNRDPLVFADPLTFDAYRSDAAAHLTFGAGPRSCPGARHALGIAAGILSATLDRQA